MESVVGRQRTATGRIDRLRHDGQLPSTEGSINSSHDDLFPSSEDSSESIEDHRKSSQAKEKAGVKGQLFQRRAPNIETRYTITIAEEKREVEKQSIATKKKNKTHLHNLQTRVNELRGKLYQRSYNRGTNPAPASQLLQKVDLPKVVPEVSKYRKSMEVDGTQPKGVEDTALILPAVTTRDPLKNSLI